MPVVLAVSVSPTRAVPLMVGAPVAGLLAAVTIKADSLVSDSVFPRSSVKDTRTLIPVSASPATRV